MDYHIFYVIAVTLVVTLHLQINPEATIGVVCIEEANCTNTETCDTDNGTCVCNSVSYQSGNECTLKKDLGISCSAANQCLAPNSACTSETCSCQDAYYQDPDQANTCSPKKDLGTSCSAANQCLAPNLTCTSGTCSCQDAYYQDPDQANTCSPKIDLGTSCSAANQCLAPNSACTSGTCSCQDAYYQDPDQTNTCSPKKMYGDVCDADYQCHDEISTIQCIQTSIPNKKLCLCRDVLYRPDSVCVSYEHLLPELQTPQRDVDWITVKWNNDAATNYVESYTVSTQERSYNPSGDVRIFRIPSLQNGTSYHVNVTHSITRHGRTRGLTSSTEIYTTLQKYSGQCNSNITCKRNNIVCEADKCLCSANTFWNGTSCAVDGMLAPRFVNVVEGTESLYITWTAGATAFYDSYYRIYWPGRGKNQSAETDSTQYNITGLQQGTHYTVSLVRILGSYGRNRTLDEISRSCATKIGYDKQCTNNGTCFPNNTNCYRGTCRCNPNYFRQQECLPIEQLKPSIVQLIVNETTRAFLKWTSHDDPVVQDFDIAIYPQTAGANITRTGHSAVISGLLPGKQYTATVRTVVLYMVGRTERTSAVSSNTVRTVPAKTNGIGSGTMLNAPNITISFKKADGEASNYIVRLTGEESYDMTNHPEHPGNDSGMVTAIFDGVTAGQIYHLSIITESGDRHSEEYTANIIVKAEQAGPVSELSASNFSSRAINVTWEKPDNPNGDLYQYLLDVFNGSTCVKRVIFNCTDCDVSSNETSDNHCNEIRLENVTHSEFNSVSYKVQELFPYTTYRFEVTAYNNVGRGATVERCALTYQEAAKEPTHFKMESKTSNSIKLKWTPPYPRPGITTYNITVLEREEKSDGYKQFEEKTLQGYYVSSTSVTDLSSYWNYTFKITASTELGTSGVVSSGDYRTKESAPTQVVDLEASKVPDVYNKIRLSWQCPSQKDGRNGVIQSSTVVYENNTKHDGVKPKNGNETFPETGSCSWDIELDITPEFNYTFTVFISNSYAGETRVLRRYMPPGPAVIQDGSVSTQQKEASEKENSLPLYIQPELLRDGRNGFVESSGILVCKTNCPTKRRKRETKHKKYYEDLDNWQKASKNDFNDLFRATPSTWLSDTTLTDQGTYYEIGKNSSCDKSDENGFCNGPLPAGTTFQVYVFVCTVAGCDESKPVSIQTKEPPSNIGVIVGAVCGVLAAVIIVIAVIAYLKLRKKSKPVEVEETANDEKELIQKKRPIVLSDFPEKVDQMHRDSNLLFSEEFEDICALSPKHNAVASETGSNKLKNRYVNILPFDHSRVKLRQLEDEDEESDYINANYIPGYRYVREYIATQGPMTGTINDFWRMIWEQKVPIIVMLSDLQEKGRPKVDRYYPENMEPVNYGDIRVEMTNFSPLSKYVIRIFKIELGDEVRTVRHYFLPGWQDFGANLTSDNVIDFIKSVRMEIKPNNTGPMCIHCSAGVGRTGTYITLDVFQQHIDEEVMDKELDIFDFVMKMRQNRSYMVQTEKQYIFIHDTIKEMVIRKKKEIAERDKNIYMNSGGDDELYVNQAFETDPCDIYMNVDTGTDKPTTAL